MDGFADLVRQAYGQEAEYAPPLTADEARSDLERVAILAAESLLNDDLDPRTKLKLLVRVGALCERAATDLGLCEESVAMPGAARRGDAFRGLA